MTVANRILSLLLCAHLAGCATYNPSIENYGRDGDTLDSQMTAGHLLNDGGKGGFVETATNSRHVPPKLSDGLAINYAVSVERVMREKFAGNRITREVSATVQVALAALAGSSAAFNASNTTIAALGLGSAGIPELQRIFNAKGRAEVYKDAAQTIRRSLLEYRSHQPNPSGDELTPNGIVLIQRTYNAIDMVDAVLAGQMPSQMEMLEITEAMTSSGTNVHRPGDTPVNKISANPSRVADAEALAAANAAAASARLAAAAEKEARQQNVVSSDEIARLKDELKKREEFKPKVIDFVADLRAIRDTQKLNEKGKVGALKIAVDKAGLSAEITLTGIFDADANALNGYFQNLNNPSVDRIRLAESLNALVPK